MYLEKHKLNRIHARPRLPFLQALAGVYPATQSLYEIDKYGRKVRRKGEINLEETLDLVFSVRYGDIARMSDSPHFSSCMAPTGGKHKQIAIELENRSVAICFTRDKAGNITNRCLVRAVWFDRQPALFFQKQYGNECGRISISRMAKARILGITILEPGKVNKTNATILCTEINSPKTKQQVWIDESHRKVGERLYEFACKVK